LWLPGNTPARTEAKRHTTNRPEL